MDPQISLPIFETPFVAEGRGQQLRFGDQAVRILGAYGPQMRLMVEVPESVGLAAGWTRRLDLEAERSRALRAEAVARAEREKAERELAERQMAEQLAAESAAAEAATPPDVPASADQASEPAEPPQAEAPKPPEEPGPPAPRSGSRRGR
jgi:hypothetical protein